MRVLICIGLLFIAGAIYSQSKWEDKGVHDHISDGSRVPAVESYRIYEQYPDSLIQYDVVEYFTRCKICGAFYKISFTQIRTVVWKHE